MCDNVLKVSDYDILQTTCRNLNIIYNLDAGWDRDSLIRFLSPRSVS